MSATDEPADLLKPVRSSVSLTKKVWAWAGDCMSARGFNNFSAYVACLIRQDRERQRTGELADMAETAALAGLGAKYAAPERGAPAPAPGPAQPRGVQTSGKMSMGKSSSRSEKKP